MCWKTIPLWMVVVLLSITTVFAGERINHAGRILGPAPVVSTPTLFNTSQGDALISAMQIFPRNNAWYDDVSARPTLSNTNQMIAKIKADLASNRQNLRIFTEMNYVLVPDNQPRVDCLYFEYPDESDDLKPGFDDRGSIPLPTNLPIETWPVGTGAQTLEQWQRSNVAGDRHSITIMPGSGFIWETWLTKLTNNNPAWEAANCAKFNLNSNALRPDGWTSGDAAGLAMLPALIRYDECVRGEVEHALRLIVGVSRHAYIYPATHRAGSTSDVNTPAMGQRLRLKASFNIPSNWHPFSQAVARAMKKYGLIVADNGGFFSVSCTPDDRFPSGCFSDLQTLDINNFEVVQGYGATEGPRSSGEPTANAGPDVAAPLATGTTLNGSVTGTGLTVTWYAYPGVVQPGTVNFGTPSAATTTVTFSAAGTYTLMLRASDGTHTPAYDAVVVTVTSGNPDAVAPVCTITTPTTNATHSTSSATLDIGGTATDNTGVTLVTWSNDRGGNGSATGTANWTANGIALLTGQNVLTVTARDAAGNSHSDTLTVTYTPPPPAAPSGLAATAVSSSQINLSWTDNSNNETSFKLERKTGAGGTYAQINAPAANATTFQNTGLTASTTYFYRIRASNASGDSAFSSEVSATTQAPPPPPAAPSNLVATANSSTQISLAWTDNANNETGFRVERKTGAGGTYAQIATPAANATSYTDAGRSPNTQYFYRVRANNGGGNSAFSNEANATTPVAPPQIPAAPTNLTATAATTTSIALQWTDNANNETSYELERGLDGTTFVPLTTFGANTSGAMDAGLAVATAYYYRVRATNGDGASAFSNVAFATTMSNGGGGGGGGGGTPPGQGPDEDFDGDGTLNALDTDDDNDGVPDSDEISAGTDPFDFFSSPIAAMTVSKLSGGIKFGVADKDGCSVSGILPGLPAKVDLTGKVFTINIGGAAVTFLLTEKGTGKNEKGTVALKLKPSKRNKTTKKLEFLGGDVAFKAKIAKGTWSDDWADEGVNPAVDMKNQPLPFVITIDLGGKLYSTTVSPLYSGKAGKTGRMKL